MTKVRHMFRTFVCMVLRMCVVNDSNSVSADFKFVVDADGGLAVDCTLRTKAQTNYLPLVGLQVDMASENTFASWFGYGPHETFPNKRRAAVLGLWEGRGVFGSHDARKTFLKNGAAEATAISQGYISRDVSAPKVLRFVPYVIGRTEKGRLKEPEMQIPSVGTYAGRLIIK